MCEESKCKTTNYPVTKIICEFPHNKEFYRIISHQIGEKLSIEIKTYVERKDVFNNTFWEYTNSLSHHINSLWLMSMFHHLTSKESK